MNEILIFLATTLEELNFFSSSRLVFFLFKTHVLCQ